MAGEPRPDEVRAAWDFAQVEEFWEEYRPLTSYGRDGRDERRVMNDRAAIEAAYDLTEKALGFIAAKKDDPVSLDRLSFHLKRMPRFPSAAKDAYELVEIFQIKKFLANYRAAVALIGDETRVAFGLGPAPAELVAELEKGGSDAESFYIADCYSRELAGTRVAINATDRRIAAARAGQAEEICGRFGINFEGREFLIVPHGAAKALALGNGPWVVEPYDDDSYLVRLTPGPELLSLLEERDALADRERGQEEDVLRSLSALARNAMNDLMRLAGAVARFDVAYAGARLALERSLVRPRLDSEVMAVDSGRFVPCESACARLGLSYTPLTARFDERAVVLFGSNMGGKTVALKTVMFLQTLAQAGLFVPARSFATTVYGGLSYVGELSGERLEGLSGFGFEIRRFLEATATIGAGALVAFDEFARTTCSHEAEALLSAVIENLEKRPRSRSFFATHFRGVARLGGVGYRRMKGLDREAAGEFLDGSAPLAERLVRINRLMKYEIVPDDGSPAESDALAVAGMLGLDESIRKRAEDFYRGA